MGVKISIYIQTHKNETVSVGISIPADKPDIECEKGVRVNSEVKNQKEIDPGYETEQRVKNWCNSDEGRIYDNLD